MVRSAQELADDPRLDRLMTALTGAIEGAVNKEGVNIPDVFAILCGVIGWLSASLPPEDRSEAESYFAEMIPQMLREGDDLRARFQRHGWGTAWQSIKVEFCSNRVSEND